MKYFRMSMEEIMWGISYQNMCMLMATIPKIDADEEQRKEKAKEVSGTQELAEFLGINPD
jgi:hypothetical protein